ncbi:tetratricopeptide repeat protein, partial [bacterium]|nr:tetratricopeptide repeat protein [bacterium]
HYRTADSLGQNGVVVAMSDASGYPTALKMAKALENLGEYSAALESYLDFIENHPKHERAPEARLAVANVAILENRTTFAKEYFRSILANGSSKKHKYQATAALGDIAFDEKRYKEANTYYLSAIRLAADEAQEEYSTRQAIRCKYRLKQFVAADTDVKQFKKKFKESKAVEAQFLDDRGHAYIEGKNFSEAEKTFKKLKDEFKNTEHGAKGEFGLGELYLITNKTEDALKILTDLPSKYPDSEVTPLAFLNLGDFYYKSQQIENAISAFRNVLAHPKGDDHHQTALRYLIQCHEDLRMWDQAISLTRRYLAKYPNDSDAFWRRIKLAKFLKELKEFNRAIEQFAKLLAYADNEGAAEIQFSIAECYQDMGRFDRAAAEYLKVKYTTNPTKLPWHVTAQIRASDCFTRTGRIDQAKQILQRVIDERGASDQFGSFARRKLAELEKASTSKIQKDGS